MLNKPTEKNTDVHIGRNLVTGAGIVRCRFDMMIVYPKDTIRLTSNPFTERGDRFNDNKDDVRKMLRYLIQYFSNKHAKERWVRIELYDNSKPMEDNDRLILKWEKSEGYIKNLLITDYYTEMLAGIKYKLPELISNALRPLIPEELK